MNHTRIRRLLDMAGYQYVLLECTDDPYEREVIERRADRLIHRALDLGWTLFPESELAP